MSSTTPSEPLEPKPAAGAAPTRRRPLSLVWRLTLAYAGSTCLLLVVAAGLMYYQLVASLDHENQSYLDEQLRDLRSDLSEPTATPAAIRHEVIAGAPAEGDAFPTYLRIFDVGGNLVAETPGMSAVAAADAFPKIDGADPTRTRAAVVRTAASHKRFYVISASAAGGLMGSPRYVAQIALDLTEEDKLLTQYRNRAWAILGPALLAAVLAGYFLARNGLRPLKRIIRTVSGVQTTTLDQRIDATAFPGELAKLADSCNAMLDRIEDVFGRLSRFSADIAHEMRTPLGCIRGELEVALGKSRTPREYQEVLGSCLEESVRLSHLIDRLLFLARAERDQAMLRRETLNLKQVLANVSEFYEASAAEAGIQLKVEADDDVEAPVDRTLLQSALANLMENALAHTPHAGTVTLGARRENGGIRIDVADTGCGIPAAHLPFVLDRFYRVDDARSRNGSHAGLGLAIVKSIATLHGGDVRVESEAGTGTRVSIRFPASLNGPSDPADD